MSTTKVPLAPSHNIYTDANNNYLATSVFFGATLSIVFLIVAILIFLKNKIKSYEVNKLEPTFSYSKNFCKKCQYYSHNSYLKCAVHPSKVLTLEAMNCPDRS